MSLNRDEARRFGVNYEVSEDYPSNLSPNDSLGDLINRRLGRRTMLRGILASTALASLQPSLAMMGSAAAGAMESFGFSEIHHGVDETHHVAPGYKAEVLLRWGDPILTKSPTFDPGRQSAVAQAMQFGYNNDFLGYIGLPYGSDNSEHGLLCVNHEYTSNAAMFPGLASNEDFEKITRGLVDVQLAAHGCSIVEIKKTGGRWQVVSDGKFNRRITGGSTYCELTGPAAGHARLQTSANPSGRWVIGTLNNCAGGITPWGTFLTAEENFHGYFGGSLQGHPEARNYARYGVPGGWYNWSSYYSRFDVNAEPNEANRFGWIVEIDPLDPLSSPRKRTALGRFKHEGASVLINKDGRVVVYSGDDEHFDYIYKFVSDSRFDPGNRAANMTLLDSGTLFVARFNDDGTLDWLPIVQGHAPLTPENSFESPADVLIETRRAADLLGATKMDRPEDIEAHPSNGRVYVMLTNNTKRKLEQVDAVNPRADNVFGHILEMTAPGGDHDVTRYTWDILVKCGDPAKPETGAMWGNATSDHGWFAAPDNCAIDPQGRLWISTDQGSTWPTSGTADGLWAMITEGSKRGSGRMFFRAPVGAELCGPTFTPDGKTLFLAVQHPGTSGVNSYEPFKRESTFADPATRWPDFKDGMPPRPSVVVITKDDGGVIGS